MIALPFLYFFAMKYSAASSFKPGRRLGGQCGQLRQSHQPVFLIRLLFFDKSRCFQSLYYPAKWQQVSNTSSPVQMRDAIAWQSLWVIAPAPDLLDDAIVPEIPVDLEKLRMTIAGSRRIIGSSTLCGINLNNGMKR